MSWSITSGSCERGAKPRLLGVSYNGCLASFSNFGNPPVDFAAPGVGVTSLARGGGTTTFSGTSMAAPHVAGFRLLGNVGSDGTACGDPAAPADPIAHF
ncbi:MAG TPA: S8 family serine peptidase [Gemmatimonadota bacterium]|nr:S8 family serine peptidase [Gemmatimonadota bacterium]